MALLAIRGHVQLGNKTKQIPYILILQKNFVFKITKHFGVINGTYKQAHCTSKLRCRPCWISVTLGNRGQVQLGNRKKWIQLVLILERQSVFKTTRTFLSQKLIDLSKHTIFIKCLVSHVGFRLPQATEVKNSSETERNGFQHILILRRKSVLGTTIHFNLKIIDTSKHTVFLDCVVGHFGFWVTMGNRGQEQLGNRKKWFQHILVLRKMSVFGTTKHLELKNDKYKQAHSIS